MSTSKVGEQGKATGPTRAYQALGLQIPAFLPALKVPGLSDVQLVIPDDQTVLKQAAPGVRPGINAAPAKCAEFERSCLTPRHN
ncbi:hypothetical protein N9P34_00505 [Actinomycetota bacterium]|nr:hypothetical protein [Actinomycetota bacterium]